MRLEAWEWDGTYFFGQVYGSKHFPDGTTFSSTANFIDWPGRRFTCGEDTIELGGSREELNKPTDKGDGIPW